MGLTIARIFVIWDDIERTPGQWDFRRYDWVYDAAAANGIRIAATLCAEDPPGWTQQTSFYHQRTDLNDPQRRKHAAEYLEKVVTRYRHHPAQGYWLLMNEPTLPQYFTPPTMARFGQWLQGRYGTVDQLNSRWFRPLKSFAEVQLDPAQWNTGWMDYPSYVDWKEFNIDNLCDQLRWIGSRVRELDPQHPTHANPHGLLGALPVSGQDLWREAKTVDFLGRVDAPALALQRFSTGRLRRGLRLLRRSDAERLPWASLVGDGIAGRAYRLHGKAGHDTHQPRTHPLAVGRRRAGAPKESSSGSGTRAPWGARAGNGRCWASTAAPRIACWRSRILPAPWPRCLLLERAVPQRSRVAILYSRPTLLLCDLEGQNVGHEKDALLSLWGCYRALLESHVPADFIDVEELKAGRAADYDVLYLPHCYALDARNRGRRAALCGSGRDRLGRWAVGLERSVWRLGAQGPFGNDCAVRFRPPRHRGHGTTFFPGETRPIGEASCGDSALPFKERR